MKKVVNTEKAPAAIGPYSQAIKANGLIFVSGQLPVNPADGSIPADVEAQAKQSLENVAAILASEGLTTDDVVKTTVFIKNMNDFAAINGVYAQYFTKEREGFIIIFLEKLAGRQSENRALGRIFFKNPGNKLLQGDRSH